MLAALATARGRGAASFLWGATTFWLNARSCHQARRHRPAPRGQAPRCPRRPGARNRPRASA
eukprot:12319712-Alexandrium_andersonii.AAC.1